MVPRLLHKPVANEVGVAFRACPLVTPLCYHTHHHSYAMEGMQMSGHEGEGVHHEGVGVAYRVCGCGLQLGMHCDV